MPARVPVLVVTGPPGVGKTTVAAEVSEQLDEAGVAHAFVDVDSLRWCYPRPAHDRFRIGLAMQNLAAVWVNFQAAGATSLILADGVESREQLARYQAAVPGAEALVVRLHTPQAALAERLRQREVGSGLERHLRRAAEVAEVMERNRVEDVLVENDGRPVAAIAREVLLRSGWPARNR